MAQKVMIIAEAGVNHNGSLDTAKRLAEAACRAGADAVKFQSFRTSELLCQSAPKAQYQLKSTSASESQFEMIRSLELSEADHWALVEHCALLGIEFMSSAFDVGSVELLSRCGMARYKVPSGEITNAPLLLAIASTGKPVLLSTGMTTIEEIEDALGVLAYGYLGAGEKPSMDAFRRALTQEAGRKAVQQLVTVLHCTSEYPCPFPEVNLRVLSTLRAQFDLPVGFSDHSPGILAPLAAVALGATVVEKHLTLDKQLPGPDHKASLDPAELGEMVKAIRIIEVALGSEMKNPAPSEQKNIAIVRKSLVARCAIVAGEAFTEANLAIKRPGTGLSPYKYWELLGTRAPRAFAADEQITL
jgi:N-acetylneuraminate synthase